jgi:hypothetical protein
MLRRRRRVPGGGADRAWLGLAVRREGHRSEWDRVGESNWRVNPKITAVLNGQKTVELHNGLFAEGPLTLQHGDGVIKFRKVAVKPL